MVIEAKKKEILAELKEKFENEKKRLGFKSSFDEVDKAFFIEDAVLQNGFVSETFSRQMCHRIVDTFSSWNNYMHSLIMPNPSHMINMTEAKAVDDEMKKEEQTQREKRISPKLKN